MDKTGLTAPTHSSPWLSPWALTLVDIQSFGHYRLETTDGWTPDGVDHRVETENTRPLGTISGDEQRRIRWWSAAGESSGLVSGGHNTTSG